MKLKDMKHSGLMRWTDPNNDKRAFILEEHILSYGEWKPRPDVSENALEWELIDEFIVFLDEDVLEIINRTSEKHAKVTTDCTMWTNEAPEDEWSGKWHCSKKRVLRLSGYSPLECEGMKCDWYCKEGSV